MTVMTAEFLKERFNMVAHEENGCFAETDYVSHEPGRAASGSIYYYLGPEERSVFHVIDCDEYWSYHAGSTLEVWVVDEQGRLTVKRCGLEEGAEPTVYFPKGCIFAARHLPGAVEGTFVSCITVPRFCYEGSTLVPKEEMLQRYPEVGSFWE